MKKKTYKMRGEQNWAKTQNVSYDWWILKKQFEYFMQ